MELENIREVAYLGNLLWKKTSQEELEVEFKNLINHKDEEI